VARLHNHNIVHCDIKLDNFMLFSGQYVKLIDFGYSQQAAPEVKFTGNTVGTIGFMAPE